MIRLFFKGAFSLLLGFSISASAATTSTVPAAKNPHLHQVNLRVRTQKFLVQKGLKAGKFDKQQALSIWASLKSVRQQELAFYKQNGTHELTSDQQAQLNQALDQNSALLGEKPVSSNP